MLQHLLDQEDRLSYWIELHFHQVAQNLDKNVQNSLPSDLILN